MRASTFLLASAAILAAGSQAQITGQIAALDSADSYCFFLPPMVGGDIAANEDAAIAFCNKQNSRAPGAKIFPPGFVLSAHWATGNGWVQITGQIDPAQYSLHPCDAGGQYDIKAPVGATCAGFNHFVNVIEPEIGVYGMKCCQEKADCDVSHSTYGVKRIYGDYDFSGPRPDGPLPQSLQCANGTLPSDATIPGPSATSTTSASAPASTATTTAASSAATSGASASATSSAAGSQQSGDAKTDKSTSAASGKTVLMTASAVLAAAVGLFMA